MKHDIRLRFFCLPFCANRCLHESLFSCFVKRWLFTGNRWGGNEVIFRCFSNSILSLHSLQEFGEDAATAINELLGLYGYDDDTKRGELSVKFHRNSCKKIANISQKLLESKRQSRCSETESLRSKMNDFSSVSSDKDSSSRETSKSPLAMKLSDGEIVFFINFY
jgi:hypothetical protein